jgi:hypothetical protein
LQDVNHQATSAAAETERNKAEAVKAKIEAEAVAEMEVQRKEAEGLRNELATARAATQAAQEELATERKNKLLEKEHDRGIENQPVHNNEDQRLMTKFFALRNANSIRS